MALPGFIFDASKGETPQSLAKKRAIIQALMTSRRAPASVPEGIDALGDGIVANVLGRRADKAEQAGMATVDKDWNPIAAAIYGFPERPAAPGAIPSGPLSKADPNVGSTIDFAQAGPSGMEGYRNAIASIESAGSGDYAAIGPTHPKLGRALGRYQVMEANIGPWSKKHLGREITADEFMANPKLQDAVFDGEFGSYVKQYGPEGAAQAWFGGPGGVGKIDRKDSLGTSIGAYGQKFNKAVGGEPQVASLDPSIGMPAPEPERGGPGQPMPTPPFPASGIGQVGADLPMTPGIPPINAQMLPQAAPQGASTPPMAQNSPAPVQTAQAAPMPEMAGNVAPMQGSGPTLQQLIQAASNPWLNDSQREVVNMLLKQEMEKQSADPLEAEYKRAQIENLRSQIQERTDPNARDRFGNSVIWGQDSEGKWVAMQPSSGGGLVPAQTPDGINLVPPGVSDMNLGTSYGIRDRAGNIISNVPIDNAGKAREAKIGEAQGDAAFDLPRVEQNAEHTLGILKRMREHPGRAGSTGFIQGLLPSRSSDQVDFQSLVDQTKGQSFLQAYQMLKGGGAITEAEGTKAENANSRLSNQRLSDEDYLQAIGDLEEVVTKGLERARKQAGVTAPQSAPTSDLKSKYGLD